MPYNRAILRALVGAAFSTDDLEAFCSDNYAEVYHDFADGQGKNDRILKLLDYSETHQGLNHLAELIKVANVEAYKEFEARLAEETPAPVADPAITKALEMTRDALQDDKDYDYLLKRFNAILEELSVLSDYKILHDGLHEIIYTFYGNIIRSTKIVMDDKYAKLDLLNYLGGYRRVVNGIKDAAKRKKVKADEDQWINQLDLAGNQLEEGVRKGDKTQIDNATQSINEVIGTRPTMVNTELYSAVYAYNRSLPEVTDVMSRMSDRLKSVAPDSRLLKQFTKGIDSLKELNANLNTLIVEHNIWQDVEDRLRALTDFLEAGVAAFNKRWQVQRARIQPFYSSQNQSPVLQTSSELLKDADALLESAIAANDPEDMRKALENYCSRASDRFFYVDKAVMELCEKLRMIHKELN